VLKKSYPYEKNKKNRKQRINMYNISDYEPNNMTNKPKNMIVMPSNNTGFDAGYLFGKYIGKLAHLHNVERICEPKQGIPWALDNGVFGAWQGGKVWTEEPLYRFLDAYAAWKPSWVVVPDWVGDRDLTLQRWYQHVDALKAYGVPLAMAVQDGMTIEDVPSDCDVVFVGGSTSWKWRNLRMWTENFPRVHVGRVNSLRLLLMAEKSGAESCDGTGWFRDPTRTKELEFYLSGNHDQGDLFEL
jgi:hypothetical protein